MSGVWERRLLGAALALALFVVAASSFLRLAGNGLACSPWPQCYGTVEAAVQANTTPAVQALRVGHRVAATTFLLVAVVLVAGAWRRWSAARRGVGAALLAVTLLLAAVGLRTPSPLPWITWANVAGGFALVALVLWLLDSSLAHATARRAAAVLLGLLAVQVLGGALLSVRLAGAECAPACVSPAGDLLALFDPSRAGTAVEIGGDRGAAVALHALHRLGGFFLALAALAWAAIEAVRGGSYRLAATAATALLALGFATAHAAIPSVAAAHAVAAALLCAACVRALHARRHPEKEHPA